MGQISSFMSSHFKNIPAPPEVTKLGEEVLPLRSFFKKPNRCCVCAIKVAINIGSYYQKPLTSSTGRPLIGDK